MTALAKHGGETVDSANCGVTLDDVERVLARDVRVYINSHAGDIQALEVNDEGDVLVGFRGACGQCPALGATFAIRVAPAIKEIPGVRNVRARNVHISNAALERVARLFQHNRRRAPGDQSQDQQ